MLKNDRSLILAKKAQKFGFFAFIEGENKESKEEAFVSTFLRWASALDFDARSLLEDDKLRAATKSYLSEVRPPEALLNNSPNFFKALSDEEVKELFPFIFRRSLCLPLKEVMLLQGRWLKDILLDDFIWILEGLMKTSKAGRDLKVYDHELLGPNPRFMEEVAKKGITPEELLSSPFIGRFWRQLKRELMERLKHASEGMLSQHYSMAWQKATQGMQLSRAFNSSIFKNPFKPIHSPRERIVAERAFLEFLLNKRVSPEQTLMMTRLIEGGDQKFESILKAFLPRIKDKNVLFSLMGKNALDPLPILIRERLMELEYLGDIYPNDRNDLYSTAIAWWRLKDVLDPKQYSDERLKRDKKLLKRISESGHSPYVISLFERGLIKHLPSTLTPKLVIYFAKKGLIRSYEDFPSLRLEDYLEVEFSLLKEGIILNDLRPIHLARGVEKLWTILDLLSEEAFERIKKDEKLKKRIGRSLALVQLNTEFNNPKMAIYQSLIFRDLFLFRSGFDKCEKMAKSSGIWLSPIDKFLNELKIALDGGQADLDLVVRLDDDTLDEVVDFILEYFEKGKREPIDELKSLALLVGLVSWKATHRSESGLLYLPERVSIRDLIERDPLERISSPILGMTSISSINEGLDEGQVKEWCEKIIEKIIYLDFSGDLVNFFFERQIKIFGKTIHELIFERVVEPKEESSLSNPNLAPSFAKLGLSGLEIQKLHTKGEVVCCSDFVASILDPNLKWDYKLREQIAKCNPSREKLLKDKSSGVLAQLAKLGALGESQIRGSDEKSSGKKLEIALGCFRIENLIRNTSLDFMKSNWDGWLGDNFYLDLEGFLRREERQRALISKLRPKSVGFSKKYVKRNSINKFIKRSWLH